MNSSSSIHVKRSAAITRLDQRPMIEQALWLDWRRDWPAEIDCPIVYIGHETCASLLPPPPYCAEVARRCAGARLRVTLVTAPLTNRQLCAARAAVDQLCTALGRIEVVFSDWGLARELRDGPACTLVAGRLISAQMADPRLARFARSLNSENLVRTVRHLDSTLCTVERCAAPSGLMAHLTGCWLAREDDMARVLCDWGIRRYEISNVAQGLHLPVSAELSCSLHISDVLVSVMRECPGPGEDFNHPSCVTLAGCKGNEVEWQWSRFEAPLFRRDNAVYYRGSAVPADLPEMGIDRVVVRQGGRAAALTDAHDTTP